MGEEKVKNISTIFEKDLYLDIKDEDVKRLQKLLNRDPDTQVAKEGLGSPENETDYYGQVTRDAVIRFQLKYGIIKTINDSGAGRVGPQTRVKLKQIFNTAVVINPSSDALSFIWPLEKSYKRITTPFAEIWILDKRKKHTGIDIAVPVEKKVLAVADGVVKRIGYLDKEMKMAKYVDIDHGSINYCTAYLHINPAVEVGKQLKAGDVIGHIAQLIEMGAHLHFNIWKGAYNNPINHRGALPMAEYAKEFTDSVFFSLNT